MRAGVRSNSLLPTSFLAISNQETPILPVVGSPDSPFCFRMIHLELIWVILCWSTFGLHTAWQGTAGQEGPKWQGTTSTKLCKLLKLRAARVGWHPRIDRVCQARFCGSSSCSTCHEPTCVFPVLILSRDPKKGTPSIVMSWFKRPIIYDVRARPNLVESTSGSRDLQMVTSSYLDPFPPSIDASFTAYVRAKSMPGTDQGVCF